MFFRRSGLSPTAWGVVIVWGVLTGVYIYRPSIIAHAEQLKAQQAKEERERKERPDN